MQTFKASVQYGDWKGTCAADDAGKQSIVDFLRAKELIAEREFLVGIELYVGENHDLNVKPPAIIGLMLNAENYDTAAAALQAARDPLNLRRIRIELPLDLFLGLFKRLSIAISPRGLDITGREYTAS